MVVTTTPGGVLIKWRDVYPTVVNYAEINVHYFVAFHYLGSGTFVHGEFGNLICYQKEAVQTLEDCFSRNVGRLNGN